MLIVVSISFLKFHFRKVKKIYTKLDCVKVDVF